MRTLKTIVFLLLTATLLNAQNQQVVYTGGTPMTVTYVPYAPGMISFVSTGSCPSGWTELSASGSYILLTVAANGDVGGTGGSTTYTPAGTNATVAFTPAGTVAAPTFTGTPFSSVINHTHTVTVTSLVQGGTTAATTGTHIMTSTATGGSARAPTSGDSFTATTANPAGGVASITPAGSNSVPAFTGSSGTVPAEAFTGSQATIQPTFIKLIGCTKN